MDLKNQIDTNRLPQHIAVIMDGNGRWAKQKGRPRVFGHRNGVKSVREVTEAAAELGVEYLTLYAFSTENWGRPKFEVNALMTLLVNTIRNEIKTLMENDVKLNAIGQLKDLPKQCYKELLEAIEKTKNNKRMTLTLALNYSAKWEIIEAVKSIASDVKNGDLEVQDIENQHFDNALSTAGFPDPELMIRTSGESRISNFLLWQLAYAELYFTPVFWPDFHREQFYEAILNFQNRERRFGKTGEQIKAS
ncbi:MAG: isoprenyl transferase [Saprospiraceae bacterium]